MIVRKATTHQTGNDGPFKSAKDQPCWSLLGTTLFEMVVKPNLKLLLYFKTGEGQSGPVFGSRKELAKGTVVTLFQE